MDVAIFPRFGLWFRFYEANVAQQTQPEGIAGHPINPTRIA
jgi:hypothetical protein